MLRRRLLLPQALRPLTMASSSRAATRMASRTPPAEPLLVVLGSTGTGKSQLAIELARRFNGEVINADAMQLYNGLPILTNKVTSDEQAGIPHHLLGHISPGDVPWDVDEYKSQAARVIREIRSRGNLPVLVGGTQYYVDPLLFRDVVLDDVQVESPETLPILDGPTDALLEELRRVDPVMAERWHPNDRRKIRRSLEIYLQTGRPASELYAEQAARKAAKQSAVGDNKHREEEEEEEVVVEEPWQNLLFWVYTEREALCKRLDDRVDRMLEAGLLSEVRSLLDFKRAKTAAAAADPDTLPDTLDMTKGIWQSIGYKQFEPYMLACEEGSNKDAAELDRLRTSALESTKTATRRYANYQTKWIRLKQIPRLKEQGARAFQNLYLFDSTDVAQFQQNVVEPAADVAARFLAGEERPTPTEISDVAREILTRAGEPPPRETWRNRTCEVCGTVCVTEQGWQRHVKGASHRRVVKKRRNLALVPVDAKNET